MAADVCEFELAAGRTRSDEIENALDEVGVDYRFV